MHTILKWLSPLIAVGVAVFSILFLVSINSNDKEVKISPLKIAKEVVVEKPKQIWLEQFSKTQLQDYSYPVTEILVQVDLNKKLIIKTIYKLSAKDLDPYQVFCLKEELKQHKLRSYLKKERYNIELLIYSQDKKRLTSLVQSLKNYNISAKISLFKKG